MNKLSEDQLIREIAMDSKLSLKASKLFIKTFKNVVINNLKKEKPVHLIGFGVFSIYLRGARKGVNPWHARKGEIVIQDRKAVKIPKFKAGFKLKRVVK
jgi:nucleoid DNA-binding protein